MTNFVAVLTIKSGKRSEYAAELRRLQLIENFRKQKGNIYYQIGESITDSDKMVKKSFRSPNIRCWYEME